MELARRAPRCVEPRRRRGGLRAAEGAARHQTGAARPCRRLARTHARRADWSQRYASAAMQASAPWPRATPVQQPVGGRRSLRRPRPSSTTTRSRARSRARACCSSRAAAGAGAGGTRCADEQRAGARDGCSPIRNPLRPEVFAQRCATLIGSPCLQDAWPGCGARTWAAPLARGIEARLWRVLNSCCATPARPAAAYRVLPDARPARPMHPRPPQPAPCAGGRGRRPGAANAARPAEEDDAPWHAAAARRRRVGGPLGVQLAASCSSISCSRARRPCRRRSRRLFYARWRTSWPRSSGAAGYEPLDADAVAQHRAPAAGGPAACARSAARATRSRGTDGAAGPPRASVRCTARA